MEGGSHSSTHWRTEESLVPAVIRTPDRPAPIQVPEILGIVMDLKLHILTLC